MTSISYPRSLSRSGFSLVEALLTIAIMGILTGLVVSAVSNASRDASRAIAKQQASAVQNAVNSWVASSTNTRDPSTGQLLSVESARSTYNAASTSSARFNLIKTYLDDGTADHFLTNTANTGKLQSEALINAGQYLTLDTWAASGYPKVSIVNE